MEATPEAKPAAGESKLDDTSDPGFSAGEAFEGDLVDFRPMWTTTALRRLQAALADPELRAKLNFWEDEALLTDLGALADYLWTHSPLLDIFSKEDGSHLGFGGFYIRNKGLETITVTMAEDVPTPYYEDAIRTLNHKAFPACRFGGLILREQKPLSDERHLAILNLGFEEMEDGSIVDPSKQTSFIQPDEVYRAWYLGEGEDDEDVES